VRILAIRFARFGDIVLLLPALRLLKARLPDSHLTFLTDARWRDLAAMCPAIDEVLTMDRIGMRDGSSIRALADILRFGGDVRRMKFDAVIDFHGFRETNLIAWWSRAPERLGLQRADQSFLPFCFNRPAVLEDKGIHVSEMFLRVVDQFVAACEDHNLSPSIVVPEEALRWAKENVPNTFAMLFIDAPVKERIWPLDRFVKLADYLAKKNKGEVLIVMGPQQSLPALPAGVRVFSNLTIPQLAATIAAARILVSNDTGPMHLGPALGTPTVGIFSVGLPIHFRPIGQCDTYVQGNPIESIELVQVVEAVERVCEAIDR
jgi:ADP-heptose:LPS heptosyltransferase